MTAKDKNLAHFIRALTLEKVRREAKLVAVAIAAETLHRGNQLEMGAVEMNRRWLKLEQALNEWRAK